MIAVIGSVAVALAGVYLLWSPDAGDLAGLGWLFVGLGVLGAVLGLVLRARTRRPDSDPGGGDDRGGAMIRRWR